ncbi:hypothetical protein BHM03_00025446 [Ensete ventricosum]|nr:hypothetical protein BHM03_00025446 [Ensete ventricosum]
MYISNSELRLNKSYRKVCINPCWEQPHPVFGIGMHEATAWMGTVRELVLCPLSKHRLDLTRVRKLICVSFREGKGAEFGGSLRLCALALFGLVVFLGPAFVLDETVRGICIAPTQGR